MGALQYAYTPTLMDANFSTWISLLTSFLVTSLFLFCMGYVQLPWLFTKAAFAMEWMYPNTR
jgi:hypothetical protein